MNDTASHSMASTEKHLPKSDVSAAVGFVGLVGLIAWVVFCRNYTSIADMFGFSGERGPLSGPYASVAALVFSAGPMVVWSVFVDKVHRRPSTGIDWDNPRSIAEIRDISIVKIAGLWATWAIIGLLYLMGRWYWDDHYLFAMKIIWYAGLPLLVLSVPYIVWIDRVMINPRDHLWHFGALLLRRGGHDPEKVKKHWRAWIIKGFFTAFMISILPSGFSYIVNFDVTGVLSNPAGFGRMMIQILFLVDVQIGTVGYLLTLRPLDAHIRSGNPFLGGWVAALICYPPFAYSFMSGGIIAFDINTPGWTHWLDGNIFALSVWAIWLTILTGFYSWATIAFGIRFSNLTYRGVLTNGPYRFTRHPAYLAKNIFWWFSTIPFLVTSHSMVDVVRNTFFLGCVSAIYYWRARTEEAHMLSEDVKYREYYAWMEENGVITSRLSQLMRLFRAYGRPMKKG